MSNNFLKLFQYFKADQRAYFNEHLTFESTPSYFASPDSCKRMNAALPPMTKFIFIIRNPVNRFWSEIEMKNRRVAAQENFISDFSRCAVNMKDCFLPIKEASETKKCIRNTRCKTLVDRTHFGTLMKKFGNGNYTKNAVSSCFEDDLDTFRKCLRKKSIFKEKYPSLAQFRSELKEQENTCAEIPLRVALSHIFPNLEHLSRQQNHCFLQHFLHNCNGCIECESCIESHPFDTLQQNCTKIPARKSMIGTPDTNGFSTINDRLFTARGPFADCFSNVRMPSDISKGYIFRGRYHVHIRNCLRYINKDRILFIQNDALRSKPVDTLNNIIEFLGLPKFDWETHSYAEAERAFDARYPKFKQGTGWDHRYMGSGEVDVVQKDAAFEEELRKFYDAETELLDDLLDVRGDLVH